MKNPNKPGEEVEIVQKDALKIIRRNTLDFPIELFLKINNMSNCTSEEILEVKKNFDAKFQKNLEKHMEMFKQWEWKLFKGDAVEMNDTFYGFIAEAHATYHSFLIVFSEEGSLEAKDNI